MGMSRLRPWQITWSNETFKFFNVSSSAMAQIFYWSKNNGMLECDSSHHLVSGLRKVYFIFSGGKVGFMGEGLLARKAREIWRYLLRGQKFGWFKKPLAIQTMGTSHITCYKTCVDFPPSGLTNVEFSSEVGLLLSLKWYAFLAGHNAHPSVKRFLDCLFAMLLVLKFGTTPTPSSKTYW